MNRKIWLLNIALLALIGSLGWLLRVKWLESRAQERAFLSQAPPMRALLAPPPPPPLAPVAPSDYNQVAQQMLFARDRNPNVVVQPPPPPPPPPPMPALPAYYGQMAIGEPVVLLAAGQGGEQKSYHTGEKIGQFKLVSFDRDSITFEWDGKEVVRKVSELAPKEAAAAAATAAPAAPQPTAGTTTSIISPPPPAAASTKPPAPGTEMGAGFRGCVAGDNSPAGTIADGYKKVISQGLMGAACYWEKQK